MSPNISQLFDTSTFFFGPAFLSPDQILRYIVLQNASNIFLEFIANLLIILQTAKEFKEKMHHNTIIA